MIASEEKKEEYREVKQYWARRFTPLCNISINLIMAGKVQMDEKYFNKFDAVTFKNGYATNAPEMTIECLGIDIGKAKPEWSDNLEGYVFRIKLGKIIYRSPF